MRKLILLPVLVVLFFQLGFVKAPVNKSVEKVSVFPHFAQPDAGIPVKILNPSPSQITGFQAIAWRTPLKFVTCQYNNVETTVNTYDEVQSNNLTSNGIATVQFQKNWGGTNRSLGINAWNSNQFGQNGNNVKLVFGAMVSIPFFAPPYNTSISQVCSYADFYLRGYDLVSQKSYWIQYSFFDNRYMAPPADVYALDSLTNEWTLISYFNNASYISLYPTSNYFTKAAFLPPNKFFGGSISRNQMVSILNQLKNKIGGNFSTNPDNHRIFAFGCTPEIALGQTGGCINFRMSNMFLRTEY